MTSNSSGRVEHLLQRDVGDRVLDQQLPGRRLAAAVVPADGAPGVFALHQGVAPVAERALGELHDVALVHQRDALALVQDGVVERRANEPLGPLARDRLDADARRAREADVLHAHLVLQERDHLLRLGRFGGPLDAGVDVLGVLAEDHHVDLLGPLHRRRNALEVAHRAQADVEVEHLADGDVERPDAAADRRGQRALDADEVGLERFQRLVGQPGVEQLLGLAARVHLGPGDLLLAAELLATAASSTRTLARQMSGPVPSPSMNGMIGRSGTSRCPSARTEIGSEPTGMIGFGLDGLDMDGC